MLDRGSRSSQNPANEVEISTRFSRSPRGCDSCFGPDCQNHPSLFSDSIASLASAAARARDTNFVTKSSGGAKRVYPARSVTWSPESTPRRAERKSAAFGMRLRSVRRDGVQSQDAPLAGNLPAGDRGPFAGEADPTCAPCEVPAGKEAGREREREGAFECNICLDVATDPVVTQCGHLYCWPCIYKYVRRARLPPTRTHGVSRMTVHQPRNIFWCRHLRPTERSADRARRDRAGRGRPRRGALGRLRTPLTDRRHPAPSRPRALAHVPRTPTRSAQSSRNNPHAGG